MKNLKARVERLAPKEKRPFRAESVTAPRPALPEDEYERWVEGERERLGLGPDDILIITQWVSPEDVQQPAKDRAETIET